MNGYLRQSTASQTRTIGPFLDSTDFKTVENALTIANTDIKIKKNGGASASKNSGGATADGAGGLYAVTWDATDTATVGQIYYCVNVAGALPVFGVYTVVEEAVYDAMFAASAAGPLTDKTGFALTAAYDLAKTAAQAGDAMALTSGERTTTAGVVMASVIEGTTTLTQALRGVIAVLFGKASGMGTSTGTFRDTGDTKNRVVATIDADGNRSAVTTDLT